MAEEAPVHTAASPGAKRFPSQPKSAGASGSTRRAGSRRRIRTGIRGVGPAGPVGVDTGPDAGTKSGIAHTEWDETSAVATPRDTMKPRKGTSGSFAS
jgi:hypothetical protein